MNVKFISYLDVIQIVKALSFRKTNEKVYYFDISKAGKILLGLLKSNQYIDLFLFNVDEIRDKSGESCAVKIWGDFNTVFLDVEEKLLKKSPFLAELGRKFDEKKVILYFTKHLYPRLFEIIVFLNVIDWHQKKEPTKTQHVVDFSIERISYFEILRDLSLREYGIVLRSHNSFRIILRFLYELFGHLFLCTVVFVKSIINHIRYTGKLKEQGQNNSTPLLANCYAPMGSDFDLDKRSYFFWLLKSNIPHNQVLIYFERKDVPASEEMVDTLIEKGVKHVAMSEGATLTRKMHVYKPTIELVKMMFNLTAYIAMCVLKDMVCFRFDGVVYLPGMLNFIRKYSLAYDFYRTFGIKVKMNSGTADVTYHNIPRQLALEALGGVNVSYQSSCFQIPCMMCASAADVYFLFGPHSYLKVYKNGNINDVIINNVVISCGYITDYSFATVKDNSRVLRKKITKNGAKFIICYFDENSSDDRFRAVSHRKSAYIYRKLLDLVINDKTIGLICSPKRPKSLRKRLHSIINILEKAEATGRCIFMDGDYMTNNYPTEAAQASDIVITLLGGGTTALESVLSGKRVVYIDLEGTYSFDEYEWGKDTVVFDNLDSLMSAIDKYRCNPELFDTLGNFDLDPTIKQKDPFRDGKAAERMGQYLHRLLEAFNEGKTREEAIQYANQNYAEMWGSQHVLKGH